MKKLLTFLLMLVMVFTFIGCGDESEKLSIKVESPTITLNVGEEKTIKATIEPSDAQDTKINFKSDNTSIATVSDTGTVKAIKEGTTSVTVSSNFDSKVKALVTIIVKGEDVLPTSIEINGEKQVEVGKEVTLSAVISPDNATSKAITWESSDKNVATINEYGVLKGISEGEVTITAIAKADNNVKNSVTVTVVPSTKELQSITIKGAKNYLVLGNVFDLFVVFNPESYANQEVEWSSSNEDVASVEDGLVTAITTGSCKITAVSKDDATVKGTVEFEVIEESLVIDDFELNCDETIFYDYDTYTVKTVTTSKPTATSTVKTQFTWESSDETVVKASKGTIETLKVGKATVTVTEEISQISKQLEIEVIESPLLEGMVIVGREITVEENVTLSISSSPAHANYDVEWSSLTPVIAEINESGYVTPLAVGEAKFQAKDKTTGITAEYTLVINKAFDPNEAPDSITIDTGGLKEVYIGYTIRLSVEVTPVGVSSAVIWEVRNPEEGIVEISEDGVLKGLKAGTARIRAISKADSKVKSSYTMIQVKAEPQLDPIPDMKGYNIVIMNAESALGEIDPFLDEYKSSDKKYKQTAWSDVQKEYNCKIVVKAYPNTAPWGTARINWLIDNSTNGTAECDFAVVSGAWINELAAGNAAVDTTRFFEIYGKNQIEPALKEASSSSDGKYRCVSVGLNSSRTYVIKGLFYNYGKLKSLGLESPAKLFNEGKWTYETFLDYCFKAQALLPENNYVMSGGTSIVWAGMVNAAGIKLADKSSMDLNITHKYSLEAIEVLQELVASGCWSIDEIGFDEKNLPFNEQRAIFSPGEYWFVKASNRYPKDLWGEGTEYGYVPFPYPSTVKKEDTKVNFVGESVIMMVDGVLYPTGINAEYVYRAVQDMYLRTCDGQNADPLYDSEKVKEETLKSKIDDPESVTATMYYTAARTIFDPMFDESFQTEYSGSLTTAVLAAAKGSDAKEELDKVYNSVKDAFIRTYG